MKQIIISPYSRAMRNGKKNPKNYPHWDEVVTRLKDNFKVIQIGSKDEHKISSADDHYFNLHMSQLRDLLYDSVTWISGDNFFPHFANYYKKPGVAIFGRSDPLIFGYKSNINLLLSRDNLRPDQFGMWESIEFDPSVFVSASKVVSTVLDNFGRG